MTSETTPPAESVPIESRNWAVGAHLSAFVMFVGIPSPLGPLAVWLLRKEDAYVATQAVNALNFNLSFLVYSIAAGISIFVLIGFLLLPIVVAAWFVLVIVGAMRASNDEIYEYPLTIRFVAAP